MFHMKVLKQQLGDMFLKGLIGLLHQNEFHSVNKARTISPVLFVRYYLMQ